MTTEGTRHVDPEDSTDGESNVDSQDSGLRRSTRLKTSQVKPMTVTMDSTGRAKTQKGHVGKKARIVAGGSEAVEDHGDAEDNDETSTEGVSQAMHDLSKLEATLKKQAKRQRRDVEASHLVVEEDSSGGVLGRNTRSISGRKLRNENGGDGGRNYELDGTGRCMSRSPADDEPLLPWNGRLGYACLNTYLRSANPPVFCSRTCRLATIQNRSHPLKHPSEPFHPTKNPPDLDKPANPALGLAYVQSLGLANARDIVPIIRWNARYGIRFMRLSSEMFPFASHEIQGYDLGFAKDVLAEAGRVAAELDHRLTTHPGQYTQLGSPRPEVVRAAIRDLEYHDQMLELLALPEQMDRDAVMVIHMGGTFGDKKATLKRFAGHYKSLRPSVQKRLVLENDDVCWSVLDILPTCEELNIPLVLDWHHHTVIYDESMSGSYDELIPILPRIEKTWEKKRITQKMHWSEPAKMYLADGTLAPSRDRRRHSARVVRLPPWRSTKKVDMCIEAKDKEQAVFGLMKRFRGEGWEWKGVGDVIPHLRGDDQGQSRGQQGATGEKSDEEDWDGKAEQGVLDIGGAHKRVFWPEGKEEWLRSKKRVRKAKETESEGSESDTVE